MGSHAGKQDVLAWARSKGNAMLLPFRQIHMDFHTSPDIPDVAVDFDGEEFARVLREAHVNSVTCVVIVE